ADAAAPAQAAGKPDLRPGDAARTEIEPLADAVPAERDIAAEHEGQRAAEEPERPDHQMPDGRIVDAAPIRQVRAEPVVAGDRRQRLAAGRGHVPVDRGEPEGLRDAIRIEYHDDVALRLGDAPAL